MSDEKFMIVVEFERNGMLMGILDSRLEALNIKRKILAIAKNYSREKMMALVKQYRYVDSYKVNGYRPKRRISKSQPRVQDLAIAEIIETTDTSLSGLARIKRERQNSAPVFDLIKYQNELAKMEELFPEIELLAN